MLAWDKPHQNQQTAVNRNKKIVHHDTMKKTVLLAWNLLGITTCIMQNQNNKCLRNLACDYLSQFKEFSLGIINILLLL